MRRVARGRSPARVQHAMRARPVVNGTRLAPVRARGGNDISRARARDHRTCYYSGSGRDCPRHVCAHVRWERADKARRSRRRSRGRAKGDDRSGKTERARMEARSSRIDSLHLEKSLRRGNRSTTRRTTRRIHVLSCLRARDRTLAKVCRAIPVLNGSGKHARVSLVIESDFHRDTRELRGGGRVNPGILTARGRGTSPSADRMIVRIQCAVAFGSW